MREAALAHLLGYGLRASVGESSPDRSQIAAVPILAAVDRRNHVERTVVQTSLKSGGRLLAEPRLFRAAA